jgi:hypothetical protein
MSLMFYSYYCFGSLTFTIFYFSLSKKPCILVILLKDCNKREMNKKFVLSYLRRFTRLLRCRTASSLFLEK